MVDVETAVFFQDRRTGKRVRRVGAGPTKEDFLLVAGNDNVPYYASMAQLMPCDTKGNPEYDFTRPEPQEPDEKIPEPAIDLVETRLNVNTATAAEIAKRVTGITYRTAKKIKENQTALPGEVYRNLDQLKPANPRLNWDEIIKQNQLFIG